MKRGDRMPRQEAIKKLKEQLVRRHEALQRAVDGDLSLLRELHQERQGTFWMRLRIRCRMN